MNPIEELPKDLNALFVDEEVLLCLKGSFKEWLICTDQKVYIYKKGFMTGHLLGNNNFQLPYRNISSVQVNQHLLSGYFEISSGGMQNSDKSFWSNDKNRSPQQAPNCISLNRDGFEKFKSACEFINHKIQEISTLGTIQQIDNSDIPEQIKKLSDLKNQGIISEEEFNNKKVELLERM